MKESDLYEPVKRWLEERGYQVYSEVTGYSGSRADVVGVQKDAVAVVELKNNLSLDLLEQAVNWTNRKYANYVYIAVPWNKDYRPYIKNWLVEYICKQFKIGVLFIDIYKKEHKDYYCIDKPVITARYIRLGKYNFRDSIEKYKHEYTNSELKGGHNGGGYITPYRVTMERVKELLKNIRYKKYFSLYWYDDDNRIIDLRDKCIDGWADINTILNYCETHYASPKPSLSKALIEFENDWCETKKEKRKLYFRYKGEEIKNEKIQL